MTEFRGEDWDSDRCVIVGSWQVFREEGVVDGGGCFLVRGRRAG